MIIKFLLFIKEKSKYFIPKKIRVKSRKTIWFIKRKLFRILGKLYRKQIVNILHIGKTGGNAIQSALRLNLMTDKYLIEFHPHRSTLRDVSPGEKVVFFLRDPVSRFVSSFNSRKRKGWPKNNDPWLPEEEIAFKIFQTPNELAMALSSENKEERNAAIRAMKGIHHVNTFFWDWFENQDYFSSRIDDIFFVGFQESLDSDFYIFKKKLGISDAVMLPKDDVKAHRTPASFDKSLQNKAIINLKTWYACDYKFLELCKEKVG